MDRTRRLRARRRRTAAFWDARVGASDPFRRGEAAGGGAAAVSSPELPQRRADAVDASAHGGGDSGAQTPSQQEICGEDGEGAAAEITACFDLSEKLRGGGARRRRRFPAARKREERKGKVLTLFQIGPRDFPIL